MQRATGAENKIIIVACNINEVRIHKNELFYLLNTQKPDANP